MTTPPPTGSGLPAGNQLWPPPELAPVSSQIQVWSAWYGSDLDELSSIYGGTLAGNPAHPLNQGFLNPALDNWRGKVGRTLARWFWGLTTPDSEKRTKLHLPVARDIASTSADLLFGEPPTFRVENTKAQERLDKLTGSGLTAALTEAAELAAGLGGVYLRIIWDKKLRGHPWISPVHADAAIPEWRYDRLTAVTFWREVYVSGNIIHRHLERHESGYILHGLYEGGRGQLGKKIDLNANAATKGLQEVVPTGLKPGHLTAAYIPNMRPAPGWRRVPAAVNLGRADFDSTEPFMDALDETYSSLMRDVRIARGRIHVPATYLQSAGPGKGATFEDREMYTPVNLMGNNMDAGLQITATQFLIRADDHLRVAGEWLQRIVATSGYSAQTFGLVSADGTGPVTATEVTAKQRRSFTTRSKKINYYTPELEELCEALLVIDAAVFGTGVTPEEVDVEFGDGVSESPKVVAETLALLHQAEAATIDTKVRILHPDWDDVRVKQEVQGIRDDQGGITASIGSGMVDPLLTGDPNQPPPDPNQPPQPPPPPGQ